LLGALDRISVIADQKSNHIVKFSIDPTNQVLTISADVPDAGSGCETIEPVQIAGEAIDIAFNVKYLMESLKNLTTTEVQLQMNTPTSPVVITPLGGAKATHLVMPVTVRS
jgi:DNA polymerase-3 subunit beta